MIVTTGLSDASAAVATAVQRSAANPADAIRMLIPLAQYEPPPILGAGGPLWARATAMQGAIASNLRASACAALARAAAAYQPSSYQDAQSLRLTVCGVLDAEAIRAADDRRDATYTALRTLRWAVALDLAVRGASLALLVEVETRVSMPSLVEAWTLYQDTSREPQLVASAAPPHPLFMPVEFPALQF
jgi:prophage DNA circulation protein